MGGQDCSATSGTFGNSMRMMVVVIINGVDDGGEDDGDDEDHDGDNGDEDNYDPRCPCDNGLCNFGISCKSKRGGKVGHYYLI